ncbi:MAG: hypothetical protein NC935_03975 [Candidatus Omnitrophica bacterium]|nr:hypothetical protein [Candidatus Omnitrophota bacterium]
MYLLILGSIIIGEVVICKFSYSEEELKKTSIEVLEENSLDKHTKEDEQTKKEIEGFMATPILPVINEDIAVSETLI